MSLEHILADFIKVKEGVGHNEAEDDKEADGQFANEKIELDALYQLLCDEGDEFIDSFDVSTHFLESQEPVKEAEHHIITNYVAAS